MTGFSLGGSTQVADYRIEDTPLETVVHQEDMYLTPDILITLQMCRRDDGSAQILKSRIHGLGEIRTLGIIP